MMYIITVLIVIHTFPFISSTSGPGSCLHAIFYLPTRVSFDTHRFVKIALSESFRNHIGFMSILRSRIPFETAMVSKVSK